MFMCVVFIKEESTYIIPGEWLIDGDRCYWCPGDAVKAISEQRPPKKNWPIYKIRVLGCADTEAKARLMLDKAPYTSDVGPTEAEDSDGEKEELKSKKTANKEKVKGKGKKRVRQIESDGSDEDIPPPPSPTPPSSPEAGGTGSGGNTNEGVSPSAEDGGASTSDDEVNQEASDGQSSTLSSAPRDPPVTPIRTTTDTSGTPVAPVNRSRLTPTTSTPARPGQNRLVLTPGERIMMAELLKIRETQKVMMSLIQNLGQERPTEDTLELPEGVHFPLADMDAVRHLELQLDDSNNFKLVVNHLSAVGGINLKDVTFRLMDAVICNAVARRYNLTGQKSKENFSALLLMKVVSATVRKNPPTKTATKRDVEQALMAWFKTARDRNGGRKERARKRQATESDATDEQIDSVVGSAGEGEVAEQ